MIHSMTGFGKHVIQSPGKKITVELKSLNSKNLDINARVPQAYREKELVFRNRIARELERGKVDFSLYVELTGDQPSAEINGAIVKKYMEQLGELAEGDSQNFLAMALRLPDALRTEREEIDPEEFAAIEAALQQALSALKEFRRDEGKALENDFRQRIEAILSHLDAVDKRDTDRLAAVRERLQRAVAEIRENVDENRFEQELIYYLEKYDITEEKVRLAKHLEYFRQSLDSADSNGKKLGFICQEIGREINTIGSKANDAPMQRIVVQMKDELEKVKEQILNVL
ncbi:MULTISPECIES: YicC/YloC family endoribonuclease [unclassified Robiginitalea]|uniref:YicC/YloC family endoribonuclease n=1 Tax=Robiginitalea TaxID=252306 RepID=UPI00234963B3|nr:MULTISPECIES: YicC/YloC family endoribonuclease [unclassified Robiginitalea]MDC6353369.1 YicC family protein [Robiginitalea sp. PM2]MDC6373466.1 YicC family protein [Robiginitalea sp. SP8]